MSEKILEVKDLVVHYETEDGVVKAVNGMEISLAKGMTLGLVGETGAGKSTTALSILRLVANPPGVIKSGDIRLLGENILNYTPAQMEKIRGSVVSMVFQDPMTSLDPIMTVGDQIAEVFTTHEAITAAEALEKAKAMLEMVGIQGNRHNEYPHQFSGGMKQRVVIAMAIACNPKLLIADEPTTALDVTIQAQVLKLMKDLKQTLSSSMIMITHDLGIVAEICDEVSVMYAGRVVEHGTLVDIFHQAQHPYTKGLFNSLPDINHRSMKLNPIKGLMPDPTNLPTGCPFHPRCDVATPDCELREPLKTMLTETHYVRCLLLETKGDA